MLIPTLESLTAAHERLAYRQRFATYARLYGPAAIAFVAVSLLPLYESGGSAHTTPIRAHGPHLGWVVLFTAMIVVLLIGTIRPYARFAGGLIAVVALTIMVVLPLAHSDLESLSGAGVVAEAVSLVVLVTGVVHQIHGLIDRPDKDTGGVEPQASAS